jgi:hypothetical protein
LWLGQNPIGDDGTKYLPVSQLIDLKLDGTLIGDEGARQIAGNRNLLALNLSHTRVGDRGAEFLSELQSLETLELFRTNITDEGLAHLGKLQRLRFLQLSVNQITDRGVAHLAPLTDLETLSLSRTQVAGTAFANFSPESKLANLRLGGCVTDEGALAIGRLPRLRHVSMGSPTVTMKSLGQIRWPESLEFLGLTLSGLDDEGLMRLVDCPKLELLWISRTKVTPQGVQRFQQARPTVRVQ